MRTLVKRSLEILMVCGSVAFLGLLIARHTPQNTQSRLKNRNVARVSPESLERLNTPGTSKANPTSNFFQKSHGLEQGKWFAASDMLNVRLHVDTGELEKWKQVHNQLMRQRVMSDDLQRWFRGTFEDPDTGYAEAVRFRLNGDLPNHWSDPNYSSFRIKFPKDRPWRHMRAVRFIVWRDKAGPIDLVVNEYARKHNLFHYRMGMATLKLNDNSPRCYSYVETITEETMALNRRTPSSVFSRDDRWLRGRYMYPGEIPGDMQAIHYRDRYNKDFKVIQWNNLVALRKLVTDSQESANNEERREIVMRFKDLVATDPYLKFCALSVLFNSDHLHADQNHKWYCDPASGRLHPIHWDTHIFPTLHDNPLYRGMRAGLWILQEDDRQYIEYMKSLLQLVEDERPAMALFDTMAEQIVERDSDSDSATGEDLEALRKMLQLRFAFLRRTLYTPHLVMRLERLAVNRYKLSIAAEGYCPVRINSISLPVSDSKGGVVIRDVKGENVSRLEADSGETSVHWNPELTIIPGNNSIRRTPQTRTFVLEFTQPAATDNPIPLDVSATNVLTDKELEPSQLLTQYISKRAGAENQPILEWTLRDRLSIDDEKKLILFPADHYEVDRNLICPAGYSVTIKAGAKFAMNDQCWLVVQGPLTIEGKPDSPVSFRPANPDKPWGGICVRGDGRTLVQLDHLQMSSTVAGPVYRMDQMGSLALVDVVARLNHCILEEIRSEDALNLVRAEASLENCVFRDIRSDAIDLDWVSGKVVACKFEEVRGDAVDCNATTASVLGCVIQNVSDKGVSCGEGSVVTVGRCDIRKCDIGVAVKDGSSVRVGMSKVKNCRVGVSLYRKKPAFSGGRAFVEFSTFDGNEYDLAVDDLSSVERVQSIGIRRYINQGGKIADSTVEGKTLPNVPAEVQKRYQ